MAWLPLSHDRALRRWLAAILLFALVVRVAWGIYQPAEQLALSHLPDQREYLALGRSLLDGQGLQFTDPRFPQQPVRAYRTPGYPCFVAMCGASVRTVRLAQALIDTSTVLAAYLLARRWLAPKLSLLAAALVAINPFLIYFQSLVLTETLFAAMLAWGMVFLVRRHPLTGGGLLAAAVLVRPSALFLPVFLAMSAVTVNRSRAEPYRSGRILRAALLGAVLIVAMLLPWAWRNSRVLGTWIWTTTNGGITRFDGFHPDATGASQQIFVGRMPELQIMTEVERDRHLDRQAMLYIWKSPLRTARLAATKIARTWSPVPLSREYGSRPLYVAIGLLFTIPFDLLIIAGLLNGRLPVSAKLLLLLPALYFTAVHALSVGSLRYRIPVEPPLAVLAAAAGRVPRQAS